MATPYVIEKVCVYASSSDAIAPHYHAVAQKLGLALAARKWTLVYGAGQIGLMGHVARAVHEGGGSVIGVIPEKLHREEIAYLQADELHITTGMRERKAIMEDMADAFITLPGGFGTLEEILEVITLKQLQYHNKPMVLLNVDGIYDGLLQQFDRLFSEQFIKEKYRALYHVAETVDEAFAYLDAYTPAAQETKWF